MEWTILLGKWGWPQVDLFTTKQNHQLPLYISQIPDPGSWKMNAMAISWTRMCIYAFSQCPIMGQVLQKLQEDQTAMILIAPYWVSRPWFPLLVDMLTDTSHSAAKSNQPINTNPLGVCSQATRSVKSSCLEIIRESNLNQGFSSSVTSRINKNVRRSSRMIYESKCTVFLRWAGDNKVKKASRASVPIIANFLGWLFESMGLKVSTIKGYRSAICRVI